MSSKTEDQIQFCEVWQGLHVICKDYARSMAVPYTTLLILTIITQSNGCTQKDICEKTFLPCQTVDTIITGFHQHGWITLRELPEDRRVKRIDPGRAGVYWANHPSDQSGGTARHGAPHRGTAARSARGSLYLPKRLLGGHAARPESGPIPASRVMPPLLLNGSESQTI